MGLYHNNIKPDNIMLKDRNDPNIYLIDMDSIDCVTR